MVDQHLIHPPVLTDAELQRILIEWNQTEILYAQQHYLPGLVEAQVKETPDAVAVIFDDTYLTYQELDERSNQLAHYLQRLGVGPDVVVGVSMERSLELVIALLSVLKAGGAYVPLDPEYPGERLVFMLEDADVSILLAQQHLLARFPVRDEGTVICLDTDWASIALEEKMGLSSSCLPANLAYVIYTSGSTGLPKGVMNTHLGICNRLLWMQQTFQLTATDRVLQKTPFSFDVSVWEFFWPLLVGASLVMAAPDGQRDSNYLVRLIIQHQITTIHFVPSMLQVFLQELHLEQCISLQRIFCSGEALSLELQQSCLRKLSADLYNLYGPTEAAIDVTFWACQRDRQSQEVPIGRPIANMRAYVLDPQLQVVPIGVPGELYISGVGLARGYVHHPEWTAEHFVPDPFADQPGSRLYRTGDLVRYLPDSNIEFLGRSDYQVKLRGFRIELGEIEASLRKHPAVQEAVVLAREDRPGDKRLVAYITLHKEQVPAIWQLLRFEQDGLLANRVVSALPDGTLLLCQSQSEVDFLYKEIFEEQTYLQGGITLHEGDCIFDVGANIGLFTLFIHQKVKNARIYAFEPVLPVFENLRLNALLHNLNVKLFPYGLSNEARSRMFTYYPHCSIISGSFADALEDRERVKAYLLNQQQNEFDITSLLDEEINELLDERLAVQPVLCHLKTLSEVMLEQHIEYIDLLKIDVEKSEQDVLAGIEEEDWPKIRQITLEIHEIDGRLDHISALLESQGYVLTVSETQLKEMNLFTIYAVRPSSGRQRIDVEQKKEDRIRKYASIHPRLLLDDLQSFLQARLPDYMLPAHFVLLAALPLTSNGKVDRQALPIPARSRFGLVENFKAPGTSTEKLLAAIWTEVLGLERISVDDNFFKLGGHSLLATQAISRARTVFQVDLPLRGIFASPTIAGLAQIIDALKQQKREIPSFPRIQRSGPLFPSYPQEAIWFIQQLDPTNHSYQFQSTLRFVGPLNVGALEQSLSEIVRRHEIYRTTFLIEGESLVQKIHPTWPVILPIVDLQNLPAHEREEEIQRLLSQEFRRPFALTELPLVRWVLLRSGAFEYILLHVEHHLVHDGWSFNIFLRELQVLYQAFSNGEPSPLPELPIQFADFALWQQQWMQGEDAQAQMTYWKRKLANHPSVLQLPTDHPRQAIQSFQGDVLRVELPTSLCEALRALSRAENVTLFMTTFAAFLTLLYRYTKQDDICIGTGLANRRWRETETLIGMLINTVALRIDLSGTPTFREVLKRVREGALEAYECQDMPFHKVVEAIQPERSLSYSPLFQVLFGFHDAPLPDLDFPNLTVTLLEGLGNGSAKVDLNVIMIPRAEQRVGPARGNESKAEGITIIWEYNKDLFEAETMLKMLGHFQTLLADIVIHPEQRITTLSLLTEAEQRQQTVDWNTCWTDFPRHKCIHELFEAQVKRAPDALAITFEDDSLTYQALNHRANQVAHYLRKQGVGPEVCVGICIERSIDVVIGILGILKAGGAYVSLDPSYPQKRLAFMLEQSQITILLTQQKQLAQISNNVLAPLKQIVCLDTDWHAIAQHPAENPLCTTRPENLAYVIYTSGSTGQPKGIAMSHQPISRLVLDTNYIQFKPDDRVAQASTFSFDIAVFEVWGALLNGAQLVGITKDVVVSPQDFSEQIKMREVSVLLLTTPLLNHITKEVPDAFRSLRHLLFGADTVDPRWIREILQKDPPERLLHVYGPTESTTFCSWYLVQHVADDAATVPIGTPLANSQIYLLDQDMQLVPVGVPGEVYIGGDGLARGYFHAPALTAERFVPHRFSQKPGERLYKTGDLARYLHDGTIEFLGRFDHQVKLRGFRIEPGEVEAALAQHPAIQEVLVLAREDEPGNKYLASYIVPASGATVPDQQDLRHFLQSRLPDYMIPAAFVVLEAFPLSPNGKVNRQKLPLPGISKTEQEEQFAAPRTPIEKTLAAIWSELLPVERVGIHDNFFALGGHSLLAAQILTRIRSTFQITFALRELFELPTIAELAPAIIRQQMAQHEMEENVRLLEFLEQLSDEEARLLLAKESQLTQKEKSDE